MKDLLHMYGSMIGELFESSNVKKQKEIIGQLEQVAKDIKPVSLYRSQGDVLADIKQAMENSDRARVFFAYSFASWYRSNAKIESKLSLYSELDLSNRRLYAEMLGLRDTGSFIDEGLYQFEQYCLTFVCEAK